VQIARREARFFVEVTSARARLNHTYIRNTPNRVSSTGALRLAEIASPSTLRVSAGSMTPSSYSRTLA
jgi:hypothetical protein